MLQGSERSVQVRVACGRADAQGGGCVVVGVYEGGALSSSAQALDAASDGALRRAVHGGDLDGELGDTLLLRGLPGVAAERVLLVGLGPQEAFRERAYRAAVAAAVKALCTTGAVEAALTLHELPVAGRDAAWALEQALLVAREALYRFDRLKSRPAPRPALQGLVMLIADRTQMPAAEAGVQRALAIADGITLAKDLGNLPSNLCTPSHLAEVAHELAQSHGLAVTVLEQPDIEQLGMGAFVAVTRGSRQPPKLIVMEYRGGDGGASPAPPIVLVGKGITFDSGGISIKPAHEMDEMKFDMCGAASVFGALRAAALMRLRLTLVGIVPATENMPGGNAMKPGDIVTTMSGQTVEILDTDCEGRLVLCDALTYAQRYRPAVVVDVATLTGEIVGALGDVASGLFSNSDALAQEMVQAGQQAWDRVWPMPLWDDYQDALKSNFADLPNIGSRHDCAVTPVCFLSRFIDGGTPWVHLDIAGTAAKGGADKGATGRPVGLLAQWLAARAAT